MSPKIAGGGFRFDKKTGLGLKTLIFALLVTSLSLAVHAGVPGATPPGVRDYSASSAKGCARALELIKTCAYESVCDADITANLPTEPRGHINAVSRQGWFHGEAFTNYCVKACKSRSSKVDADAFRFEVCGYADDLSSDKKPEQIKKR